GDNAFSSGLTNDQRGTGFLRSLDAADAGTVQTVDIGAVEVHPSVEDIADKATNEDTPLPSVSFNVGDSGLGFTTITATSSNQTLVPDANVLLTGSGATRTLAITPVADRNGTATITVTVSAANGQSMSDTFVLTVTPVNDAPLLTAQTHHAA